MTWIDDIPKPLLDLLDDFELHGIGHQSIFKNRQHILLGDVEFSHKDGFQLMTAIPLIPEGVSKTMFQMVFFHRQVTE